MAMLGAFLLLPLLCLCHAIHKVVALACLPPLSPNRQRRPTLSLNAEDPVLSLNLNLDALTRTGASDRALELYSRIYALYEEGYYATAPDVVSFNTVLNGLREDPAAAMAFFDQESERVAFNTRSFNLVLLALARQGLHTECLDVVRIMEERGVRQDRITYNTVLQAYASSSVPNSDDTPRMAENLLEKMIERSQKNKGISPDVVSFNTVATCWARQGGNAEKAQGWLERMRQAGLSPDVYSYSIVMEAWADCGGVDEALQLLEDMKAQPSAHSFPNRVAYTALVKALGKKGRMEEAHNIVKSMWESSLEAQPDLVTYSTLLDGWARIAQKRPQESISAVGKILQEMRQRADQGLEPNDVTYTLALKVLARAGTPLAATRAHELVASMDKPGLQHLNALLNVHSKSGHKDRIRYCVDTFKAMKRMGVRDRVTYNTFLQALSSVYGAEKFKQQCLLEGLSAYNDFEELAQSLLDSADGNERLLTKKLPCSMTYSFLVRLVNRCGSSVAPDKKRRLFRRILKSCGPVYGCLNSTIWEQLWRVCTSLAKKESQSVEAYLGLPELMGEDYSKHATTIDFHDLPAHWSRRALPERQGAGNKQMRSQ